MITFEALHLLMSCISRTLCIALSSTKGAFPCWAIALTLILWYDRSPSLTPFPSDWCRTWDLDRVCYRAQLLLSEWVLSPVTGQREGRNETGVSRAFVPVLPLFSDHNRLFKDCSNFLPSVFSLPSPPHTQQQSKQAGHVISRSHPYRIWPFLLLLMLSSG